MRTRATFLLIMFVMGMGLLFPQKKQITIGETKWYTEQNTFEEVVAIAQKEKKPILAMFSATWCKPCQNLKKEVLSSGDFKKVADETLLLYIEQTVPEGMEYCKKNNIRAFPTVKLFNSEGVLLETAGPKSTTADTLAWIRDVKGGNNAYDIAQKLKKNPKDRGLIMKLADKLPPFKTTEKLGHLETLIKLEPNPKDPLTQEAYEKMIAFAPFMLMTNPPEKRKEIAQKYETYLKTLVKEYYPDKFRYTLKPDSGIPHITALYNHLGQYKKAYKFFGDYVKKLPDNPNYLVKIHLYSDAMNAMLHLKKEKEADAWLQKIKDQMARVKDKRLVRHLSMNYLNAIETFIKFYAKNGNAEKADKYVASYLQEADRAGQKRLKDAKRIYFATSYGVYLEQTAEYIDRVLAKGLNANSASLVCDKARILYKMGKAAEAKKVVTDFYKSGDYLKKIDPRVHGRALNNLAWVFVELDMIDEIALDIAERAVKMDPIPSSMDTLARIHANLGHLKKAIELEKMALSKTDNDYHKTEFKSMITKWENMVK